MIDLGTAVQRYHERRKFYAWDIYEVLSHRHKAAYTVLQQVARFDKPVTADDLATAEREATPGHVDTIQHHMTLLSKQGFVRWTKLPGTNTRQYWLSELGAVVLSCDPTSVAPSHTPPTSSEATPLVMTSDATTNHGPYDWSTIEPEAHRLRSYGIEYRELAQRLGVPHATLKTHMEALPPDRRKHSLVKRDWSSLVPQIISLLEKNLILPAIAEELDIPLSTLKHNQWQWEAHTLTKP